ncbi:FadR/GntR family transcriptional regulator [Arthrobacter sedimenti]|uniref:FadR/GntR family transcriptional regulator n=1 Tax=Arthrobacter sedimenti TaxID=2694931 RepID=UPI000B35D2AD|nr:FCD domain-containing protein [Arthrobacter sedimenti]OUM41119.1 GntR family transcriptional regulator [Arthrobacter agilis]
MTDGLREPVGAAPPSPVPPAHGRRSAIDAVRARIAASISLGLLQPGERLPDQNDIALGLSVSPMTARRAMASLAEEGIVVRRRGRDGGTFVAADPPAAAIERLSLGLPDAAAVHDLVDRRLLAECAVTHFAAVDATEDELEALEALTQRMATATNWSEYHQADDEFHRSVAAASHLGAATAVHSVALAELYEHFVPYPIDALHRANEDHVELVAALRRRDVVQAVAIAHAHVDSLHSTMFMELARRA